MDRKEQIRRSLVDIAGNHGPAQTVLALVDSVDETEATCVLDDDGLMIYDVRLKPVVTGDETLVMFPAIGSWVLAVRIEDDEDWMVIACQKVSRYRITADDCIIEMDAEGVKISKGSESLKDVLSDLLAAIKALTVPTSTGPSGTPINAAAFTALENRVNNFLK